MNQVATSLHPTGLITFLQQDFNLNEPASLRLSEQYLTDVNLIIDRCACIGYIENLAYNIAIST